MSTARNVMEVCVAFLRLGLTSFGGPVAHLGYFRNEFVEKRAWLTEEAYADLVALCQFLPGPASSQVVFAIGMKRAGLLGAVGASACFMLPSVVLMIAFAYGVAMVGDLRQAGWVHGLKLAAVAVVAQAVWGMGRRLCPDRARVTLALIAAALTLAFPGAWSQVGVIALGAIVGWQLFKREQPASEALPSAGGARGHLFAAGALVMFGVLLFVPGTLAAATGDRHIAMFDSFYRSGALVFGGGHVVLPLLREEVVPRGWVSDDAFLAGYGAAQAVPGPLFTFAAYLGTVMEGGKSAWMGGVWCVLAVFLPAWLLVGGVLPFWERVRMAAWAQAGLRGANAAVVGVLLAALYSPVWTQGIRSGADVAAAVVAFGLLEFWKAPPLVVVLLCAAAGQWVVG